MSSVKLQRTVAASLNHHSFKTRAHRNKEIIKLCKEGQLPKAVQILLEMDHQHIWASTYSCLLQGCINLKALGEGKKIHSQIIKSGLEQDIFIGGNLIRMYVKCGKLVNACQVFNKMDTPSLLLWNIMIAGHADHGHVDEAFKMFEEMSNRHVKPDKFTLTTILKVCASLAALEEGKWVHAYIFNRGIESDCFLDAALVNMYSKCGCIDEARQVFDEMATRDVVTWTTMLTAYAQHGLGEEALKLFQQMQFEGMKPNIVSWNALLTGYAQHGHIDGVLDIFRQMQHEGLKPNVVSWTALVVVHAKQGWVHKATEFFQLMQVQGVKPDVVSWNTIIGGYTQHSSCEEALKLFWLMQQQGIRPDNATATILFTSCAMLLALEQGRQVHDKIIETGLELDVSAANTLIEMYMKCGSVEDALQVFRNMPKRNLVSWTMMIAGYGAHGHAKQALRLFEEMQYKGLKPDEITYTGVLSACSHSGLEKEGCHYFDSLIKDHGIVPNMEHYTCMVDLLGHVGHLLEALNFMSKMPYQPDVAVWRTLLAACRLHGSMELEQILLLNMTSSWNKDTLYPT